MLDVVPGEATGASLCWGEDWNWPMHPTQSQAACVPKDLNDYCPAGPETNNMHETTACQSQSSRLGLPSVLHDASSYSARTRAVAVPLEKSCAEIAYGA